MLGTLLLLFPMAVGALVMRVAGAPMARWGVHLAVGAVGSLLFLALGRAGRLPARVAPWLAGAALAAVAATFASSADIEGVRRWLALGAFRIHPSALVGPALVIFAATRVERAPWQAHAVLLVMAGVHVAQPDAGQAMAWGAAAMVLTLGFDRGRWPLALVYAGAIAAAWLRPDKLAPAPFVEDIVSRSFALSPVLGGVAIASSLLAVLAPISFVHGRASSRREWAAAAALTSYFAFALASSAMGEFPVPLLGFGSSPALGAFLGIVALRRVCRFPLAIAGADRGEAPPGRDAQRAVASLL